MKRVRLHPFVPLIVTLFTAPTVVGCETALEPSTTAPFGYNFSQDFQSERRVLRLGFSADEPARCMTSSLPPSDFVTWKSNLIDPSRYNALVDLATDDELIEAYDRDTLAVECNDWNCERDCRRFEGQDFEYQACLELALTTLPEGCTIDFEGCDSPDDLEECIPRPNDDDFCYIPQASASFESGPWRFALSPDFTPAISAESQALIDAFLEAHEACWNP